MTLSDIVGALESTPTDLCIFARRPWTSASEAILVRLEPEDDAPAHVREGGYEYFLEVSIALEDALGEWIAHLSLAQRFDVVLHYAEYDAWPEWFNEFAAERSSGRA